MILLVSLVAGSVLAGNYSSAGTQNHSSAAYEAGLGSKLFQSILIRPRVFSVAYAQLHAFYIEYKNRLSLTDVYYNELKGDVSSIAQQHVSSSPQVLHTSAADDAVQDFVVGASIKTYQLLRATAQIVFLETRN